MISSTSVGISAPAMVGTARADRRWPSRIPGLSKYRLGSGLKTTRVGARQKLVCPGMFSLDPKLRPDGTRTDPWPGATVDGLYNPYSDYNSGASTQVTLPEAWVGIGNVVASQPELNFWAGNRYYRRQDIYINDFFYWNVSGGGAGLEDYRLPVGKLAFAWIGNGSQSGVYSDVPAPDPANKAGFSKSTYDIRWYDLEVPGGMGEVGVDVARTASGRISSVRADDSYGAGITLVHTAKNLLDADSVNRLSAGGQWTFENIHLRFPDLQHARWHFILRNPGTRGAFASRRAWCSNRPTSSPSPRVYVPVHGLRLEVWHPELDLRRRPAGDSTQQVLPACLRGWRGLGFGERTESRRKRHEAQLRSRTGAGDRFFSRPVENLRHLRALGDDLVGSVGGLATTGARNGASPGGRQSRSLVVMARERRQ